MLKTMLDKLADVKARREDGEGGFTLIELLVVVVIIGILVAIAIPLYLNYTQGAKNNSLSSDVRNGVVSVNQCMTANNQNLPTGTATFTSTAHTFPSANANCPAVNVVVSNGTASLVYTYTAANGSTPAYYTLVASDSTAGGVSETYNSSTGQITQGTHS